MLHLNQKIPTIKRKSIIGWAYKGVSNFLFELAEGMSAFDILLILT